MVELFWEQHGVVRRHSGRVSKDELDSSAIRLQANERVDELHYIIHDFSAATEVQVQPDDIEFMAVRASVALLRNPKVKIAFVGDQPVILALIEAFETKGVSAHRCHHFATLEGARRFIGL